MTTFPSPVAPWPQMDGRGNAPFKAMWVDQAGQLDRPCGVFYFSEPPALVPPHQGPVSAVPGLIAHLEPALSVPVPYLSSEAGTSYHGERSSRADSAGLESQDLATGSVWQAPDLSWPGPSPLGGMR